MLIEMLGNRNQQSEISNGFTMDRLLLFGLNHTTAPLEVRERLAFNARQQAEAVAKFRQQFDACELVLLSTCNRVEFYIARAVHGHPREEELIQFPLRISFGLPPPSLPRICINGPIAR